MLDDLKLINQVDKSDALGVMEKQWQQLEHQLEISQQDYTLQNVVFSGMGGSALAALFTSVWPNLKLPFEIIRGYSLPSYIDDKTLVIVSSYSGNTEESLATLEQAIENNCQIVTISAGGKLAAAAKQHQFNNLLLPTGLQPRHATLASFKALVTTLEAYKVAGSEKAVEQLLNSVKFLKTSLTAWAADVPTAKNQAKQIAEHFVGKTPIIYGGLLYPVAYKWKINFNENSKNTAWCNQLPEANHNESTGWTGHPIEKPFGVIDLISRFDHPQVQKRFAVSDRLLSGKRPKAIQIQAEGNTQLEQLLWTLALGDVVSVYLAVLNGVDPTPVDMVEKFKVELAQN